MEGEVRKRIETRISAGQFMSNILRASGLEGSTAREAFAAHLTQVATFLAEFLRRNDRIGRMDYAPAEFWPRQRGRLYGFVDGGVANVALPGSSPLAIRVGTYVVRPGDETDDREDFEVAVSLVDDLYDEEQDTYEERFEDVAKLRDAARIIAEAGACSSLAARRGELDAILLQGPLVNPVAPYGTPGFPAYTATAAEKLSGSTRERSDDRHFVRLYRSILESTRGGRVPVAGVVERDSRGRRFLKTILDEMEACEVLDAARRSRIDRVLKRFDLSDTQLLDLILGEGEYVVPLAVDRQGEPHKWPQEWAIDIERYPRALTSFLKPSVRVQPVRIEMFEGVEWASILSLVLHTSRLLPGYGFPVGLDVVDRFAKVPDWMSRNIATGHKVNLLRKAFATDDARVRDFAVRMLSANGRDWLYRPKI